MQVLRAQALVNTGLIAPELCPVSLLQESLWRQDQAGAAGARDRILRAFRLRGELRREPFCEALRRAVDSHPPLRTRFHFREQIRSYGASTIVQVIAPEGEFALDTVSGDPMEILAREREHRFDLARGPLIRAVLVRTGDDEHVLICNVHRIIADEKSVDILLAESSDFYAALLDGESPKPVERPSYADFAVARDDLPVERQIEFWKNHLSGPLPAIELPADHRRGLANHHHVSMHEFALPSGIEQATALAGLMVLLGRYTGAEEVLIGVCSDRRTAPFSVTFGPFENTLLLKMDLTGDLDVRESFDRAAAVLADASAAGDVPLGKVVDLNPGTAPFQVEFDWRDEPPSKFALRGLEVEPVHRELRGEIAFRFRRRGSESCAAIDYHTGLFDRETIETLAGHYERLLEDVASSSRGRRISEISFLSATEERQIVHEWNRTERAYPRDKRVHQLFEEQAARTPQAIAATFDGENLTYAELNARANRLAWALRRRGVAPGHLVGIAMHRSLEMLIGVYGILKAGGAYVPLDPAFPAERLAYMMEQSGLQVLVTHRDLDRHLTFLPPSIVHLESEEIAKESTANLSPDGGGTEAPSFVIYTSGSTGRPKGVPIPHRALVNLLCSMRSGLEFSAKDVVLAITTLSFDIAGLELHLPLICGARVVIAKREHTTDGVALAELIESSGATFMQGTPATWQLLADAGWQHGPGIRILTGGDALRWPLAEKLLPNVDTLFNAYGPTETTIYSTMGKVAPGDGPILIGRSLANIQTYILDSRLRPVPPGVVGEIYHGGDCLSLGYLHQPELTAKAFLPNPFPGKPGTLIYKTGDLGRYRRTGEIECLGRSDQQVKIRGFRIEPGEIEAVLLQHPSVAGALVRAWTDANGRKHLVAYLEASAEKPAAAELREFLSRKLPPYMVPSFFVTLDKFPQTPNRKIDKRALPPPDPDSASEKEYVAPRTATEKKLAAIWQEMLGIGRIGVRDNYFDLGAESLVTARVFGRIRREFAYRIGPEILFESPTVAQLAEILDRGEAPPRDSSLVPIQASGSKPPLFCIHGGAGTILFFRNLPRYLSDRPVYGLQARGLYGDAPPMTSVQEMADAYLAEIRRVQKKGPYRLLGFCFGSQVALEIAHRIRKSGESVALLAFLNGPAPAYGAETEENLMGGPDAKLGPWKLFRRTLRRTRNKAIFRIGDSYIRRRKPIPERMRDTYFLMLNFRAELAYRPEPYAEKVVMFRARGIYADPLAGWGGILTGEIENHEIPGKHEDHRAIVEEPAVALVGEALNRALERADAMRAGA